MDNTDIKVNKAFEEKIKEHLSPIMQSADIKSLINVLKGRTEKQVVIVKGPQGQTGKTTLVNILKRTGFPVFEEYQVYTVELDRPISK